MDDFDYIVLNCGHHPAAHAHFTFSMYHSAVTKLFFSLAAQRVHERSRIFWVENTAQPLREDHWVIQKLDWRTYHRLILFDAQAKQQIAYYHRLHGLEVGIVPAFYSTMALYDKICDCAHYPASAKIPQLVGLIDAVRYYNGGGGLRGRIV